MGTIPDTTGGPAGFVFPPGSTTNPPNYTGTGNTPSIQPYTPPATLDTLKKILMGIDAKLVQLIKLKEKQMKGQGIY